MRIGIIGAGESGIGAALLAKKMNYELFVSDGSAISDETRDELEVNKIPFEEKGHSFEILEQSDVIVKSPGIPGEVEIIRRLRAKGLSIISEVEFAYQHCDAKIVGITGSNGKTTTASLVYHVAQQAGLNAYLCGNVGESFSRALCAGSHDWYIVEVSSFQLDDIERFRPDIGVLLNITPDHLDRYQQDFDKYAKAKLSLALNMESNDRMIYYDGDQLLNRFFGQMAMAVPAPLSRVEGQDLGALIGHHNKVNAACALQVAEFMGIETNLIFDAFLTFEKPEHRMESFAVFAGIEFINDSKATNVDSVFYAIDGVEAPIIWIAGGQDKGNDYGQLLEVVGKKVKALICLGVDNSRLLRSFEDIVPVVYETNNIDEAVAKSIGRAESGDVILLSPACASFDLFNNYQERGRLFKRAVFNQIEK